MSTKSSPDFIEEIVTHHQEALVESRHMLQDAVGNLRATPEIVAWRQEQYTQQAGKVGLQVSDAVLSECGHKPITREGLPNISFVREAIGWLAIDERFKRVYDLEQRFKAFTGARQRRGFGPQQMRSFVDGPLEQLGSVTGYGRLRSLNSLEEVDWRAIEQKIHAARRLQFIQPSVFQAIIQPQVQQEAMAYGKAFEPYRQK